MTREEAVAAAEAANKPLGFCPVINATCRTDCVVYGKAQIGRANRMGKEEHWYVVQPFCNNWTLYVRD